LITILATIFIFLALVFVHELGHFLAARSVGVKVNRLSLGFPPRLFSFSPTPAGWIFRLFFFRKSESRKLKWEPVIEKVISNPLSKASGTEYSVALIPLGGYVKMAGAIDEGQDSKITGAPDELTSKNRLQQAWVMSAGVLMNILLAIFVFAGVTFSTGIAEKTDEPMVMEVVPDYPADEAGIQAGDKILSVDGEPIHTWTKMTEVIHAKPLETVLVRWQRDGELFTANLITKEGQIVDGERVKNVGRIGILGGYEIREASVVESFKEGFVRTGIWFGIIVKSLKMIASGEVSFREIGGPILIAQLAGKSAQAGFVALLSLLAIISVNLAFINILPIPALDGGHILIILIESMTRHELSVKVRTIVQQAGMALLLLLILVIIYNDLTRLFFH